MTQLLITKSIAVFGREICSIFTIKKGVVCIVIFLRNFGSFCTIVREESIPKTLPSIPTVLKAIKQSSLLPEPKSKTVSP